MTKPLVLMFLGLLFGANGTAAAQSYPIQSNADFVQAQRGWMQGQHDAALRGFRELCESRPDDGLTWLAVADFLSLKEAYREATPFAKRAVELVQSQRDAFLILAQCHVETGGYAHAETAMQAGVKHFPDDALMHFQLGSTKALNQKILEARASFREAVRLEPSNARYQYTLGASYARANEFPQAERHLARACRGKSKHADALWQLAQVIAFQDRPEEAEPWFLKALSLPDTSLYRAPRQKARYAFAVFLYEQRRHDEAEKQLQEFLAINDEDRMAWMYLGRVQNALGKRDEAQVAAQRYRELQTKLDREEDGYLLGLIENLRQFREGQGDKSEKQDGDGRPPE